MYAFQKLLRLQKTHTLKSVLKRKFFPEQLSGEIPSSAKTVSSARTALLRTVSSRITLLSITFSASLQRLRRMQKSVPFHESVPTALSARALRQATLLNSRTQQSATARAFLILLISAMRISVQRSTSAADVQRSIITEEKRTVQRLKTTLSSDAVRILLHPSASAKMLTRRQAR